MWSTFLPPLSHHRPSCFRCGPKILLAGTEAEEGQDVISGGEKGSLFRFLPSPHCTHPKFDSWALPQPLDRFLVSQMHFPEYHEYSFHSLSWSAQRKAKKAKLLLLNSRRPEIWESTQQHNISSLKGEFQAKIFASHSTIWPISIRVSTLRHVTKKGHLAVILQLFQVQAESSCLHFFFCA